MLIIWNSPLSRFDNKNPEHIYHLSKLAHRNKDIYPKCNTAPPGILSRFDINDRCLKINLTNEKAPTKIILSKI